MSEIPVHPHPRRLADWINPAGAKKVHSLIDKIYQRKNLEMAWERVRANRGSGGVDGQSVSEFAEQVEAQSRPPILCPCCGAVMKIVRTRMAAPMRAVPSIPLAPSGAH